MKARVVNSKKKFEPVVVEVEFETEKDLTGCDGFITMFDDGLIMECDDTNIAIREALKEEGYV